MFSNLIRPFRDAMSMGFRTVTRAGLMPVAVALVFLSAATSASAGPGRGELFATDPAAGNLITVDTTTGEGTVVGSMGLTSVPSLAVDPTTGVIYAGEGGGSPNLHTVDPDTGALTLVGDSGLGVAAIGGMDFDESGTLYAAVNIAGDGGTGSDHLAILDKDTGAATVIGPFGYCGDVVIPSVGDGSCTIEGIEGIAFDEAGQLWGSLSARGAAGTPGLYRIDTSTGAATFMYTLHGDDQNAPSGGVVSLQFACDGTLYGGTARAIGEEFDGGLLVTIEPDSGYFEYVGFSPATSTSGSLAALAFGDNCTRTLGMVADDWTGSVTVFDARTDTVLGSVALPGQPFFTGDCSVTADQTLGFATDFTGSVWVIDLTASPPALASGTNPIPISNNGEDTSLSPDGNFLVVCDGSAIQPVSVIALATMTEVGTFSLPSDCNSVDVCGDGSVLVTSNNTGRVHRLILHETGALSDTGEFLDTGVSGEADGPNNVICAPGSTSGLVITRDPLEVQSFLIPGLTPVDVRDLTGPGKGVSGVIDATGERAYLRSNDYSPNSVTGSVDVFEYDAATGALGAAPLLTIPIEGQDYFYGMDQIALHPNGEKLYVSEEGEVNVYDPETGTELGSVVDPAIVRPMGVCLVEAGEEILPLPSVSEEVPTLGSNCEFGASTSGAGDLNGDQVNDFIAGGPGCELSDGSTDVGAVGVYYGVSSQDQDGELTEPEIIYLGEAMDDRAGTSVSSDFDFNGDGTPDILIGAPGAAKVYLIYFDPSEYDLTTTPLEVSLSEVGQTISGVVFQGTAGDMAGFAVAGGCLANPGMGEDIVFGAPASDVGAMVDAGRVYVVFDQALSGTVNAVQVACNETNGPGCGTDPEIDGIIYEGAAAGDMTGWSVACPGNVVEGPGDDIVFGAPRSDPPDLILDDTLDDAGRVYGTTGGDLGKGIIGVDNIGAPTDQSVDGVQILGTQAGEQLGYMVAGGGDNLENGEDDLLMGAPFFDSTVGPLDDTLSDSGRMSHTSGTVGKGIIGVDDVGGTTVDQPTVPGIQWIGCNEGDRLGIAGAGIGDLTGNGKDDIAFSAPFADPNGVPNAGIIYVGEGVAVGQGAPLGIVPACEIGVSRSGRQLAGVDEGEMTGSSISGEDVDGNGLSDLIAGAEGKDDGDGAVFVTAEGAVEPVQTENRPPNADAGPDQMPECQLGNGRGAVTLDGSASDDPDGEIVLFEWFLGSTSLGTGAVLMTDLALGVNEVALVVTDNAGATDTDTVTITVMDRVAPVVTVTASPDRLWPPNHQMSDIDLTVTAIDACEGDLSALVLLSSVTSNEDDDAPGVGDGKTTNDIQDADIGTADFDVQLRAERAGAGSGRVYTIEYTATDSSGNSATGSDDVAVPHDQDEVVEPVTLALEGGDATRVSWDAVHAAVHYDVIRGNVAGLRAQGSDVNLGTVSCVESESIDTSTRGQEDLEIPPSGQAFFYLVQFNDGIRDSSYGTESVGMARTVGNGGCN